MNRAIQNLFFMGHIFHDCEVFIQNKVLFLDEHPGFAINKINDFIHLLITNNKNGMKISEWRADLENVVVFYDNLNE